MKAAIVTEAGKTPVYGDFPEPIGGGSEDFISITASALSHLVRGRASGQHYSSSGVFPFVVGVDGVGRLVNGKRVYFLLPKAPYGSMAERVSIPKSQWIALPEGLDDVTAAAIANPGMSSFAAFRERAKLKPGETVLINGATGTAGQLAVQIAKHLGAKKVVATGRNPEALKALKSLGADVVISLTGEEKVLEEAFREKFSEGIDVVIDYLWGKSAEQLLTAGAKYGKNGLPLRFIQVGSSSGPNITLSGAALRSSAIVMMGSGLGSVPMERLVKAIEELFKAAVPAGFKIATQAFPLSEVEKSWGMDDKKGRIVFTIS